MQPHNHWQEQLRVKVFTASRAVELENTWSRIFIDRAMKK